MRLNSESHLARRQAFAPQRILWLVGLGMGLSLLGDATLYVVLPTQYAQAGILATHVGLMLSANRAIRIFINGPLGVLIERIPRRRMLIPSLFMGGLATLLYVAPGFWPLLIGRLLWGMAWAGIALGSTTVILDIATDANRGQMVGRYQMWMFIGMGSSSLFGGVLFDAVGYAPTFLVSGLIILMGAVLWLLFLPETRPDRSAAKVATATKPDVTDVSSPPPTRMSRLPLVTAMVLHGLNWLLFIGMSLALLPVLLQARIGPEIFIVGALVIPLITFTGALSAVNTVISLLSAPLSGWLSDRSGNRWQWVVLALTLGIVALGTMAVGGGVAVIVAAMIAAAVMSTLTTQLTALVGDYARPGSGREDRQGRVLGMMNTVGDLGGAAGPFLAFLLLPEIGLDGLFALGALLLIPALPAALWMMWQAKVRN